MTPMHVFKDEVEEEKRRCMNMKGDYLRSEHFEGAVRMDNVVLVCNEILEHIHHGYYDEGMMRLKLVAAQNIQF